MPKHCLCVINGQPLTSLRHLVYDICFAILSNKGSCQDSFNRIRCYLCDYDVVKLLIFQVKVI